MPRADISKDVEKVVKKLQDGAWKTRKEGLEDLEKLVQAAGGRIKVDGLSDLFATLKNNLREANPANLRAFIAFSGKFAEACGRDLRPHSKVLLVPLIANLANKSTLIHDETVQAMDRFAQVLGADQVIAASQQSLEEDSPELRASVLKWIMANSDAFKKVEVQAFVTPVLKCLTDKSKDIRTLAEQLLEKALAETGPEAFANALKDFKPAV